MAASIMQVARTLGQLSGWTLSNLQLQKIAYIAEMIHLGRTQRPLIVEEWQAWDYGPVQPELYHKAKVYGTSPVRDIFNVPPVMPNTSEHKSIADAFDMMRHMNPGRMVAVTHQPGGAWATHYRSGLRGGTIPKADIAREYQTLITDD